MIVCYVVNVLFKGWVLKYLEVKNRDVYNDTFNTYSRKMWHKYDSQQLLNLGDECALHA